METQKPMKLSKEEFIKTVKMFYIDDALEQSYENTVAARVSKMQTGLIGIAINNAVQTYVRVEKDALDNLLSLLNISTERFKRIITMLRLEKGHQPEGEWELSTMRNHMLADSEWMNEVSDLLTNGGNNPKYQGVIPPFYLENFKIDITTLGRLANIDDIRRLVKKKLEGQYSNKIGDSYLKTVTKKSPKYARCKGWLHP
ncbi:MAG: hypothetical protein LBE09_02195 [Christensenellaceae bacterium]|jgi:hypothetical protein|nr:hypothetical protein [Christensenellaceae bacterium]